MPPRVTPASGPAITRRLGLLVLAAACAQHPPVPEDIQRPAAAHERPVPADAPPAPEGLPADSSHVSEGSLLAPALAGSSHVPEDSLLPSARVPPDSRHVSKDGRFPAPSSAPADTSPIPKDSPLADRPLPPAASVRADVPPVPGDISSSSRLAPPPPGLVDLRAELPGACFDVRYATADNFTGAILPGYAAAGAWLRPRPAGALARVQAAVSAEGLTLLVYDAYRPARASLAMVEWAERSGRRQLVDDGYIARRSGHNRGDTLDLTLARPGTCEPLDMGTAWDHFGPESHYARARGDALAHRRQLRRAMQAQGFTPYDKEWWHFTFHDPDAAALDLPYQPAP